MVDQPEIDVHQIHETAYQTYAYKTIKCAKGEVTVSQFPDIENSLLNLTAVMARQSLEGKIKVGDGEKEKYIKQAEAIIANNLMKAGYRGDPIKLSENFVKAYMTIVESHIKQAVDFAVYANLLEVQEADKRTAQSRANSGERKPIILPSYSPQKPARSFIQDITQPTGNSKDRTRL